MKERKIGLLVEGALLLVLLSSVIRLTFAPAPTVTGVLFDVQYPSGTGVPRVIEGAGQTFFVVVPGGSYKAVITNVEEALWGQSVDVWIKGTNQDGGKWQVHLYNQQVDSSGTITTDVFQIPRTAGCTIQVAYWKIGHETLNPTGPGTGHMKTYSNDTPPHGEEETVPCGGTGVPEFPIGPEAIAAVGLLSVQVIRRKQKH